MNSKEYEDKIKKFAEELNDDIEELNPSFAESELIYSLRNYVNKRFDLLKEYLHE